MPGLRKRNHHKQPETGTLSGLPDLDFQKGQNLSTLRRTADRTGKNEIRSTANFVIHEDLSEEKEIMVCHPSAMNYLGGILLGLLTCMVLIGFLILLYIWIDIHFTSYRITTQRIIVRQGWIAKYQNEIWIKDMRGANLTQGIWQRIIGVGNISIGTAATAGAEICMKGIANPQKVVDQINKLRH